MLCLQQHHICVQDSFLRLSLCCAVLQYAVLSCAMLSGAVLCCAELCSDKL